MVLKDVANRARLLVERGSPLDPDRLGDRDLHVVDELAVPDRFEDPVREPQRQHVLDGLLAEEVVDPEDLLLGEVLGNLLVQLARGGAVVAERLFDEDARPAVRGAALADLLDDRPDHIRRHREVVDAVSRGAALVVELIQGFHDLVFPVGVGKVRGDVARTLGEPVPDVVAELVPAVLLHRLAHHAEEVLGRLLRARDTDDPEAFREQVPVGERVERGEELAPGQVPRSTEDDERAGIRHAPKSEALQQRILGLGDRHQRGSGLAFAFSTARTAWPPNWFRSAAFTLAANDSSWRDAKRAKSAALITGTGTSSAIASAIVQRPSPESST